MAVSARGKGARLRRGKSPRSSAGSPSAAVAAAAGSGSRKRRVKEQPGPSPRSGPPATPVGGGSSAKRRRQGPPPGGARALHPPPGWQEPFVEHPPPPRHEHFAPTSGTHALSLHRCAFTEWPISGGTAAAGVALPGGGYLLAVGRASGVVEVRSSALGWGTLAALPAPPVEGATVGRRLRGGRGGDGVAGQLDGAGAAVVAALAWAPTPVGVLLWAARRDGSLSLLRVGGGGVGVVVRLELGGGPLWSLAPAPAAPAWAAAAAAATGVGAETGLAVAVGCDDRRVRVVAPADETTLTPSVVAAAPGAEVVEGMAAAASSALAWEVRSAGPPGGSRVLSVDWKGDEASGLQTLVAGEAKGGLRWLVKAPPAGWERHTGAAGGGCVGSGGRPPTGVWTAGDWSVGVRTRLVSHGQPVAVWAAAFLPTGNVVTGDGTGRVVVWGAAAVAEAEFRVEGLVGAVTSLAAGELPPPDGAARGDMMVFVGAENGAVGALRAELPTPKATGAAARAVTTWSAFRGRRSHDADVRAVASLGGGVWASTGLDAGVVVWSGWDWLREARPVKVLPSPAPAVAPVTTVVPAGPWGSERALLVRAAANLQLWTFPSPPVGRPTGPEADPVLLLEVVVRGVGGAVLAAAAAPQLTALAAAGVTGGAVYWLERVAEEGVGHGGNSGPLLVDEQPTFVVVPAALDAAANAAVAGARRLEFVGGARTALAAISADGRVVHLLVAAAAAVGGKGGGGVGEAPAYQLAGSWSVEEAAAVAAGASFLDAPTAAPLPSGEVGFVTMAVGGPPPGGRDASPAGPVVAVADTHGRVALLSLAAPLSPRPPVGGPSGRPAATFTCVRPSSAAQPVTALAFDGPNERLAAITAARRVHVYDVTAQGLVETPWSAAYSAALPLRRVVPESRWPVTSPFAAVWPGGRAGAGTILVFATDFAAALVMGADPPPYTLPLTVGAGVVDVVPPAEHRASRMAVRSTGAKVWVRREMCLWAVPGGQVMVLGPFANVLGAGTMGPGGEVAVVERPTATLTQYLPQVLPKRSLK